MTGHISRREFLKLSAIGLGALAFTPAFRDQRGLRTPEGVEIARVTRSAVKILREPLWDSEVVYIRGRDELLNVYYSVDTGEGRNPVWYRVWGGFVHSAFLQAVRVRLNTPLTSLPGAGRLVEVSVPFTPSMLFDERRARWQPNYRLYYGSNYWITDVRDGPDGMPWYQITDHYGRRYYAAAEHLRPIPDEELAPLTPGAQLNDKWIEISIADQMLWAYEKGQLVLQTHISSGLPQVEPVEEGKYSSETPTGDHHITVKAGLRHMGSDPLSAEIESGALPGVPWVCFFREEGYALHGTYWHSNFGYRMSSGCINLPNEHARWLYRWTQPVVPPDRREFSKWGTRVTIF